MGNKKEVWINSEYSDISIELFEKTIPIFKGEF